MIARLTSAMIASALVRRVSAVGGNGAILAKGDATAGAMILVGREKGQFSGLWERILDLDGRYIWRPVGPQSIENEQEISEYLERCRARDPDLWIVELDIANAERFAAEMTARG